MGFIGYEIKSFSVKKNKKNCGTWKENRVKRMIQTKSKECLCNYCNLRKYMIENKFVGSRVEN